MKKKVKLEDEPLSLSQIAQLKNVSDDYSHLGQDYILTHITTNTSYFYPSRPPLRRLHNHNQCEGHHKNHHRPRHNRG